jgi:hypothetical protein
MSKKSLVITKNYGGLSGDLKEGVVNSFAYSKHIDFRKKPTAMSILPKTVKETGATVTGLITNMIQLPSGKMVAIDSSGGVYTRTTAGVWAKNGTTLTSTTCGMSYDIHNDTIYISGLNNIHTITNADGKFGGSFTVNEEAITRLVDKSATSSANTYTTTGSITETATHKLVFTPNIEPMYSIHIWVTTKGTGDLVVTLHDESNNTLSSKTVANASLSNGALNAFVFDTPVSTLVKTTNAASYHVHITHPSGTASTIGCATASDFSTARYSTYVNRLVSPTNGLHPMMTMFGSHLLIGNGRYLVDYETIKVTAPTALELLQHRLTFSTGTEITSLCEYQEYYAIGTEKRSTSATNEFQEGNIYLWDGTSVNYNISINVPEGAVYSLFSQKGVLYWFAGGGWWAWAGGKPVKIAQMPNTDFEYTDATTYMVNYPHTMTVRNGILLGAFPSETNSTNIEHGVYSYGSRDKNYPESLGYSYTISTGTSTNGTLRIGMIKSFGDKLFISWRDGASYGVDLVDTNSDPFGTATWQSLIIDNSLPFKNKLAIKMYVDFEALPTGSTVTPKYKINRDTWVTGTAATATSTQAVLNINSNYKEIQLGIDLVATTATPVITGITLVYDDLKQEAL